MPEIKSVAVAGATGTLGGHVIKALVATGFVVKILSRSAKPADIYADIEVTEVDYTSVESLTAALKGIDAVVSTVGTTGIRTQDVLIEAAAIAGVKRFIPAEYGVATTNPQLKDYPVYADLFKFKSLLQEKADAGQMSWTVLACGGFLEFLFEGPGSFVNLKDRKVRLFDDGDNKLSATSLAACGDAIAGILKNSNATANRVVRISQVILTQNKVLDIAKKLQPKDQWEIEKIAASTVLEGGLAEVRAGNFSYQAILDILQGTAFAGETYGSAYAETDNELLGIKELTEEDLTKLVAEKLA